jgi:hypothetical protein
VQVALVVAAHQLTVSSERHVTFFNARAHACARFMAFPGVLRELQRAAASMGDREIRLVEGTLTALFQFALERAGAHLVNQVERARPDLDAGVLVLVAIAIPVVVVGAGHNGQQARHRHERHGVSAREHLLCEHSDLRFGVRRERHGLDRREPDACRKPRLHGRFRLLGKCARRMTSA